MKIIQQLITGSILAALVGCHNIDVSVYGEDENIFITTHRGANNKDVVIHLEVGSTEDPYNNLPAIKIKLPSGKEVNLASLNLDEVRDDFDEVRVSIPKYLSAGHPNKQWPNEAELQRIWLRSIPLELSITLFLEEGRTVYAYFRNDSYATPNPPLQIKAGNSNWYSLPLKKKELIPLFGDEKENYSYGDWQ